ncbi:MAG: hypothetical protein QXI90_04355 [Thermofilum sp.]
MKATWILVAAIAAAIAIAVTIPVLAGALAANKLTAQPLQQEGYQAPCCPCPNATAGFPRGVGKGFAPRGYWRWVEVSSEYESGVLSILQSDPDASKLLQQGFNVTAIKPLITARVQGTGDITLKAKQAVVVLKGSSGYATVLVDVEQGKVLKIVTFSKTVVTKE